MAAEQPAVHSQPSGAQCCFSFSPAHVILWIVGGREGQRTSQWRSPRKGEMCQERNVTAGSNSLWLPQWRTCPFFSVPGNACWNRLLGRIQISTPRRRINRAFRPLCTDRDCVPCAIIFPRTELVGLNLKLLPLCILVVKKSEDEAKKKSHFSTRCRTVTGGCDFSEPSGEKFPHFSSVCRDMARLQVALQRAFLCTRPR